MSDPLRVAFVGCGNVATAYAQALGASDRLRLIGVASRSGVSAAAFADHFGIRAYNDVDALLADPDVDAVVNLTTQTAHAEITRRALEARKHVYSEKPMALSGAEANELVALAARQGVRLSAAPSTFLAPPQREAIRIVRSGDLGTVRLVYAEANWGRLETWHPTPEPFYEVGPAVDVGVYPITFLTAALGPVARVKAYGRVILPERQTLDGRPFAPAAPDFTVAMLEFVGGAVARLTADFYVARKTTSQRGAEFHGDAASLVLDTWFEGNGTLLLGEFGADPSPLAAPPGVFERVNYGLGLEELAAAVTEGRPQQASGAHAAHVVSVLEAITVSASANADVIEIASAGAW